MTPTDDVLDDPNLSPTADGFDLLDASHIRAAATLVKLAALVTRLAGSGPDEEARTMAAEVITFFSTTSRQHHEDEERHVFPNLLSAGNAEIVQDVRRLQQDHAWLEADWAELAPQVDAVACGQGWYDVDTLREGANIFAALLRDHMALEESIIYPEARRRQLALETQEMGREMRARRTAERESKSNAGLPPAHEGAHQNAYLADSGPVADRDPVAEPTDRRNDHAYGRGRLLEPDSRADPFRLGEKNVHRENLSLTREKAQRDIGIGRFVQLGSDEPLSNTIPARAVLEGSHIAAPGITPVCYRVQYEVVGNVVHYEATVSKGQSQFPCEGQFNFEPSKVDAATAVDAFMQNHISKSGWNV
jgi:hemerythrin-like domain-containing protein